ncbi:hypothetical protein N7499_007907 [Penicillium canescens]|uniref:Xylanolytic transcriptional activator regulatory domain-containing protein n=1 Tax=Penicillium canescens TaxID=5083 RepID=A0AAD6HYZ6_PENCN|nr:uncharacterized protein N7446_012942 [Penicillium canescens]KAJ6022592.1 hypothetical protein N7460_012987 [Penicillium canescens]KAJ6041876.1 hypothetical protein N7446_012942 [Penicillium canescens]KAJ6075926.1 hypothetical protein N7499_007907 [Penicillium canescens]KAJ6158237.1 hypothetical protein N7485_011063 [Penicillium canescens]
MVGITPPLTTNPNPAKPVVTDEAFWEEHSTFATGLPQSLSSPSLSNHANNEETYVKQYFEHFHPSFPLLHRPTFTVSLTPKLLLEAVTVIGSLFSPNLYDHGETRALAQWRQAIWQSGQEELRHMVSLNCSEIRQPWVMQAWLLYIIYGVYASEAGQFQTVKKMLRQLIDAVREIGLSQQGIAMPDAQSWMYQHDYNSPRDDSQTLYTRWMSYITTESMRLSLYTLVFLDSHTFSPCNSRPLMSPMELGWELPFPINLWEAKNSEIWLLRFNENFGLSTFTTANSLLHGPRGVGTASLTIATQQLMTETPDSELLSALEASPFAAFCVLTNMGALVRDFTRCYYQMPPSPSDPNPFHILTQAQNKQVHTAIEAITKIVKKQAYTGDNPQFLLWRTNELFISSLKISLCRPDQLLVGGIVDNSLIAGMAASTHLTQGNLVAIRRSAPLVLHHVGGDEGILALLNDLSGALSRISGEEQDKVVREAPWVTVTSYGVLLCIWGALKRASTDIRHHLNTFNELPKTSESCMLIFNTLMESALLNFSTENDRVRDPRLWTMDREAFVSLLDEGESLFVNLIKAFCQRRSVWGIGPSMLAVLGEIPGTGPE